MWSEWEPESQASRAVSAGQRLERGQQRPIARQRERSWPQADSQWRTGYQHWLTRSCAVRPTLECEETIVEKSRPCSNKQTKIVMTAQRTNIASPCVDMMSFVCMCVRMKVYVVSNLALFSCAVLNVPIFFKFDWEIVEKLFLKFCNFVAIACGFLFSFPFSCGN